MLVRMLAALALPAVLLSGLSGPQMNLSAQGERTLVAQSLSSRCATPIGTCRVEPQPIGTPCFCEEHHGIIIP